jgi:hypothetical protein
MIFSTIFSNPERRTQLSSRLSADEVTALSGALPIGHHAGVPGRVRVFKTTLNDVRDLHRSRIATATAYVCAPTRREAARLFGVVDDERITEAHIEKGAYVAREAVGVVFWHDADEAEPVWRRGLLRGI